MPVALGLFRVLMSECLGLVVLLEWLLDLS